MSYLDALQDALAAEHGALFVVGYLGAQTSSSAEPTLFAALSESYVAHRALRDALTARVRDAGSTPVAAAAAYEIPDVGAEATRIRLRAVGVERGCAAAYGFLVANSAPKERGFAVAALVETAVRETTLGGAPRPFPGR